MNVLRIFADADGVARVERRAVPLAADASGRPTSARFSAREFFFRDTPVEHDRGKHRAPQRQLIVVLGGIGEIVLDDGSVHRFGPGDLVLAENTTGGGHVTRNVDGVRSFLHLPVPDDFDVTTWPLV
jgi:hypothetical protein